MNSLEKILKESSTEFRDDIVAQITPGVRYIREPGGTTKTVNVKGGKDLGAQLNKVCPGRNFLQLKEIFRKHYEELSSYISLSSSPQAFKAAWDLRSSMLTPIDVETIISLGGQIIPINNNSRVLRCEQQGVLYGEKQLFILGVRHSEGNYEDSLDDLGRFSYQPPKDVSGLLRYRFLQKISKKIEIDLIVLAIMWFEYKINNKIKHVFILAPAKLIDYDADLNNLDKNLANPLSLQIIQRTEALNKIDQIFARDESNLVIKVRSELDEKIAREFSYIQIKDSKKGKKIKKWAQNTSRKCPGTLCKGAAFSNMKFSQIAFGHIVSQEWSRSFPHIQGKVNHPDNLYLTCNKCNSSLLDYFPDKILRDKIIVNGTIGDWLRTNLTNIRNTIV